MNAIQDMSYLDRALQNVIQNEDGKKKYRFVVSYRHECKFTKRFLLFDWKFLWLSKRNAETLYNLPYGLLVYEFVT